MNLKDIKLMLNDYLLKNYDFNKNLNYSNNKQIILKFLEKYPYFHRYELLYLLKNKDRLEDLHIFCKMCGCKNNWSKSNGLYHIYCSNKCKSSDPYIKEKISIGNKKVAKHTLQERRKTNQIRHGNPNYHNVEQMRITRLNDVDENGLNSFDRSAIKYRQTLLQTRGVDNYSKTKEFKNIIHNKKEEMSFKRYNTKKKNHTLNSSNAENIIHQFLIYKFNFEDIIHHYYDKERYPFECDFYIKSLDLFIELNFYWTHGFEPYDKNNPNHQERLNNWIKSTEEINFKKQKKDGYKNAIYIWTIDDPNKLATFKRNNLNYKIFYNLEEFIEWYSNI